MHKRRFQHPTTRQYAQLEPAMGDNYNVVAPDHPMDQRTGDPRELAHALEIQGYVEVQP